MEGTEGGEERKKNVDISLWNSRHDIKNIFEKKMERRRPMTGRRSIIQRVAIENESGRGVSAVLFFPG